MSFLPRFLQRVVKLEELVYVTIVQRSKQKHLYTIHGE